MSQSIKSRLSLGLAGAGLGGAGVLALVVAFQYRLFTADAPTAAQTQLELLEHVVLPLGLFLGLFGFGVWRVVRSLERKLLEIAEDVHRSAQDLRAHRAPLEDLPLELQPFVSAINNLTQQLDLHARRQEAFASDAAHELKTPLALLALELDTVDAAARSRLIEHVQNLSQMIDQLLLLARCNSALVQQVGDDIEPGAVARRVVAELAPSALDAGRSLSFEEREPTRFLGLEEAVSAAVRTIVDNAVRATPAGGNVTVIAGPGKSICVVDGGPGLSAGTLETLKARGVRSDSAPGGSAGLGLAIADRIMQVHDGELQTCMPQFAGIRMNFEPSPYAAAFER